MISAARILERCRRAHLLEANGHRADENLKLEDLYKATEVIALSLIDMLSDR